MRQEQWPHVPPSIASQQPVTRIDCIVTCRLLGTDRPFAALQQFCPLL